MATSEEFLAVYAASRDADAFTALVRAHAGMVFSTCKRIVGNAADAEEVAQECFLELARNTDKVRGSVGGWLHGIATRKALRAARSNQRRRRHEARAERPADNPSDLTWTEMAPVVDEVIEELPDDLRQALLSYYFEERSQARIAQEMGLSQPTVSRRVLSAVEMVRDNLRKRGILVAAVALAPFLQASGAEAAPATLTGALTKMAVAGIGQTAALAGATGAGKATTIGGGITVMKASAIVVVLAAAVVGIGIAVHPGNGQAPKPVPTVAPITPMSGTGVEPDAGLSADELYGRMYQNAKIHVDTARGQYLKRSYYAPETTGEAHRRTVELVDAVMSDIARSYSARGAAKEFEEKADSMRAEMMRQHEAPRLTMAVETYYLSGGMHRTDHTQLAEGTSLDEYAHSEKWRGVTPELTTVWNGSIASMLDRGSQAEHLEPNVTRMLGRPTPPQFLTYGREVPDPKVVLGWIRAQNLPITVANLQTKDGEKAFLLEIGESTGEGMYIAMTVLPDKGYVTSENVEKKGGVVVRHDEFDNFVKTPAGFWVPLMVKTESYRLNEAGAPTLASRTELVALEPPQVNIEVEPGLFELVPASDTVAVHAPAGWTGGGIIPDAARKELAPVADARPVPAPPITAPVMKPDPAAASLADAGDITPNKIFEKVAAAYESMQTYKAEGTVVLDTDTGALKMTLETSFSILLKRPNLYLISWTQKLVGMGPQVGAVWSDGTQPYLYMGMMHAYSKMGSDELALGTAAGLSNGVARTIPSLFMPVFKGQSPFSRLKDPQIEKSEIVGEEDCYVVSGASAISKKETYWISKATHLVLKHARSLELPEGGVVIPEMTDEQLDEAIKLMGQKVTDETRKNMREMKNKVKESLKAATESLKNAKTKGFITETHEKISSPDVNPVDFQLVPPNAVLKDSLFGSGVSGGK